VGGGVDAAGETADDAEAGACELETELFRLLFPVVGCAARPDHPDRGGVAGEQCPLHVKEKGRIVDRAERFGVVRVVERDEGDTVIGNAALFLGEVDAVFPIPDLLGHVFPDSRHRKELAPLRGEDGLWRIKSLQKPPDPDRADAGQEIESEIRFLWRHEVVLYTGSFEQSNGNFDFRRIVKGGRGFGSGW